jgi:hypothetical protein
MSHRTIVFGEENPKSIMSNKNYQRHSNASQSSLALAAVSDMMLKFPPCNMFGMHYLIHVSLYLKDENNI